jgi:flavin-dependent dehydrogenase
MHAPVRFAGVIDNDGRACGARLETGPAQRDIAARWVLIASGASPQALIAAGLCDRRTPSGVALRGYVRNARMAARLTRLDVVWHPRMKRGYGWIFPCGEGVFNIGVGVAHSHAKGPGAGQSMQDVNLRAMLDEFVHVHPDARDLVGGGEWLGPLKGAPLRCSLEGAQFSRPGLMVVGEAAGSTYAFTGEGIGKAMETGMLAADAVVACERSTAGAPLGTVGGRPEIAADARAPVTVEADTRARADYERALHALLPRYRLYEKANAVNNHPWLVDLLVWSARRSPSRVRRMSGVLEETHIPSNPLSTRSWVRLLFVHS